MPSTLIPAIIRRECIELDRLVETCLNRYHKRDEFARSGTEEVLADSLATCLHSFYTGMERIFEIIVRDIDGAKSSGPEWHREVLAAVSVEKPGLRPPVISDESFDYLENYRAFRHLFRHLYTHRLEPDRIFRLIKDLGTAWQSVKKDLQEFISFLEAAE